MEKSLEKIEKRQYKPSLFSVHIFPFLEDNFIFEQNGVRYARCFGEKLDLSYCDPKIKSYFKEQETSFTLPDYRDKALK